MGSWKTRQYTAVESMGRTYLRMHIVETDVTNHMKSMTAFRHRQQKLRYPSDDYKGDLRVRWYESIDKEIFDSRRAIDLQVFHDDPYERLATVYHKGVLEFYEYIGWNPKTRSFK